MKKILIIEPYCTGFEHVKFNSGLIAAFVSKFGDAQIEFWAEAKHQTQVMKIIINAGFKFDNLILKPIAYSFSKNQWLNLLKEIKLYKSIYTKEENNFDMIVFLSISNTGILAVKKILKYCVGIKTVMVPHGILKDIEEKPRRIWNRVIDIRHALLKRTTGDITYLALSETIYKSLVKIVDQSKLIYINHPYIFDCFENDSNPCNDKVISFGIMGALRYGFQTYCKLAYEVKQNYPNCKFILIGHLNKNEYLNTKHIEYINEIRTEPISYDKFEKNAKKIDYLIWITDPTAYRYTASCVLIDSFNYLKPGIYLKNELIQEYFDKMGCVGYICDDYNHILATILSILNSKECNNYQDKVKNIINGRIIFSPEYIRNMLDEI